MWKVKIISRDYGRVLLHVWYRRGIDTIRNGKKKENFCWLDFETRPFFKDLTKIERSLDVETINSSVSQREKSPRREYIL